MTYTTNIRVGFLNIEKNGIYLIGYPIKLSPTERILLCEIAESKGATIDTLLSLLSSGVSRGNVAVHINSINRKAEAISGRRLVLFENEKYILNPFM